MPRPKRGTVEGMVVQLVCRGLRGPGPAAMAGLAGRGAAAEGLVRVGLGGYLHIGPGCQTGLAKLALAAESSWRHD